jgi:trimeric autotransporter adhesin
VSPSGTPFAQATGYLIRMPNDAVASPATQTFTGVFTGVPYNGNVTKAITYNGSAFGYNMIGNPYPSTVDADAFITANTANIESSLYFWRKINAAGGSAYAVYNSLGSTATPSSAIPNGVIQVGQGFFVKAKSASSVTFTNAMRVANNANQFFRIKAVQKDRLWLNLTNASGVFSQTLVGYTAEGSQGIDVFDAKYINDSPVALTSNINNEEYSIQGRSTFDASDIVALNFKTDAAGDYTIALDHSDGVFATGQDVYLVDSKTGTETNLKSGAYTFNATSGVDNARFSLKYQKTLAVDAAAFNENGVRVYRNNGTLYVNSGAIAMSNIQVFDIQGRLIVEQKNVKATTATINNLKAKNQVLIVKIMAENNTIVTKKVLN